MSVSGGGTTERAGSDVRSRQAKEGILLSPGERAQARSEENELEQLARWMDSIFEIPGIRLRFGLDALIGLIPGLGDTITSLISLYILTAASRYGVSRATMARMAANIAVDYVFGAIPLLGDVFDVYWKANQKNVALLRRHAAAPPGDRKRQERSDRLFVGILVLGLIGLAVGSIFVAFSLVSWLVSAITN